MNETAATCVDRRKNACPTDRFTRSAHKTGFPHRKCTTPLIQGQDLTLPGILSENDLHFIHGQPGFTSDLGGSAPFTATVEDDLP